MKNILDYGIIPDGKNDFSAYIETALKEYKNVYFPNGKYLISKPISMPSNSKIKADKNAEIIAKDNCFNYDCCYGVVTNEDLINGNENIEIDGGIFNGNNINNARKNWRNGPCTGLLFNFMNVKGLTLKNILAKNSESYHFRIGKTEDFLIENIEIFDDYLTMCQDGIHVGGGSHNGVIKNVFANKGNPNDDLIAFNADDTNTYCQNFGMQDLPISNMLVDGVYAEDCWTAVRILSVHNAVENITLKNFKVGVRELGINFDAGRYSEDPQFKDGEYPNGVGYMKNITFENFTLWRTRERDLPVNVLEQNGENITIKNFTRDLDKDKSPNQPFMRFKFLKTSNFTVNDNKFILENGNEYIYNEKSLNEIIMN